MNIKAKIIEEGKTLTEVAELLSQKYGDPVSIQNLSNKIRRKSLRLADAEDIADVLGCELVWKKKEPQQ
jgi:hypoxanthine-guanine phosphoribosyltransferase